MPIDFPTSPTTGQVYTYQGKSWVYNGTGWDSPRALSEIGAVQTFANAAARTAAIPTPTEGIVSYLNDVDLLSIYDGTGWGNSLSPKGGILQVVSTTKTDTFSTTSSSFIDVTGLSVDITPKSSTSKFLIILGVTGIGTDVSNSGATGFVLVRNSTIIAQSTVGDFRFTGHLSNRIVGGSAFTLNSAISHLDSPLTGSVITYKIQGRAGAGTLRINTDPDGVTSVSTITVLEVGA